MAIDRESQMASLTQFFASTFVGFALKLPTRGTAVLVDDFLTATYHQAMRTQTVNTDQAKNQLAELIAWAAAGGEILIVDNDKALARLVPPGEPAGYGAHPPTASEFYSDEDSLAWDADGWETVA